jgi:Zinc carboxypeptidase
MLSLLFTLLLQAPAQPAPAPFSPGTAYDSRIPTLEQVVGHGPGEEITSPEQIATYLRAVERAAPDRAKVIEYARTWQGRPLHIILIGAPERMKALDAVRAGLQKLADPRQLAAGEGDELVRTLPVVTWLMHAVHGDEISSSDAALLEAYHLLAAQGNADVDVTLRESIVIIDPLQNPDGRARFLAANSLGRAMTPDPEPFAAEHDQPWPGGRSNHYLFDMNRDWFAQSQPETRGRTAIYLAWFPHVVVDLHEMGGDSTYYFAPPAEPLNPHITTAQRKWFDVFGRENARRFDERGFGYFIREQYDAFYPGYGESWPIFQGAVGMTYEQASAEGLVWRREDETLLTYRDGVLHHFTAAVTTAATAARNREAMLRDFLEYRRSAVAEGERGPVREYLLVPGGDPSRASRLAGLLAAQGFDVQRATDAFSIGDRTFAAGTFIVPAAQPGGRLLRNLMDPHTPQPEAFVKEQDRRRLKRLPDQIYDITAWSLPALFDVEVITTKTHTKTRTQTLTETQPETRTETGTKTGTETGTKSLTETGTGVAGKAPRVGYLMPWGSGTAAAVVELLKSGVRARFADRSFALGGRRYPAGTVLVRTSENAARSLSAIVPAVARRHDAEAVPIETAYVDEGISLGSSDVVALKAPRVLLGWDTPAESQSAGHTRYVLERRFAQAVTPVRIASLGKVDLARFDVVVLPSGNYADTIAGDTLRRLKDWIQRGGTLVTMGEASRWATRSSVGLLATHTELRDGRPDTQADRKEGDEKAPADDKKEPPAQPIDVTKAVEPERERPWSTPGALVRVALDLEHWLAAGTDGTVQAIVEGQRVFSPLKLDKGRNVGLYAPLDRLVAGGLIWPEAQKLLANKAYLMHQPMGEGHVVAFAENPNFRAFSEASELLFMNAILLATAH